MTTTYLYTVILQTTDEMVTTNQTSSTDVTKWNFDDASLAFVITVLICLSNVIILLAFFSEKRLRVYSNYYVINMAIADLLVGLTAVGPAVIQILYGYRWPFGYISCAILIAISHAALHVSIIMVLVISVDRWYAVYHPLKHISMRSRRSAIRRNLSVWLFSVIVWSLVGGVWGISDPANRLSTRCSPLYTRHFATSFAAIAVLYWFPVSVTGILYFLIYRRVRSSKFRKIVKDIEIGERRKCSHVNLQVSSADKDLKGKEGIPGLVDVDNLSSNDTRSREGFSKVYQRHYRPKAKFRQRSQSLPVLVFTFSQSSTASSDTLTTTLDDIDMQHENSTEQNSSRHSSHYKQNQREMPVTVTRETQPVDPSVQKARRLNREKGLREADTEVRKRHRSSQDVTKTQRTLSLLLLALIITWTPYACFVIAVAYCHVVLQATRCFPAFLSTVALLISWANSLLNPFMYAAAQPLVRQTVTRLILCKKTHQTR